MKDRVQILHAAFVRRVREGDLPQTTPLKGDDALPDPALLKTLFESQLLSRHLDFQARKLQARGEGFYTIGSTGHEGNAAIAAAFRADDMAFLHYRDAAFFIQRANMANLETICRDMLLSFMASSDDPISGGRHKVLGSADLHIPPQTSTIASHLPKAVGAATSIALARSLGHTGPLRRDGVVLCSFGDASLNHSTAQGAINTASWMAYQQMYLPLVLICEDNGIGISTPTPDGWVHASMHQKPGIRYVSCNGQDVVETYRAAREVEAYVRTRRKPVFLHMRCVRLLGHAGADAQHAYLSEHEIAEAEAHDPLLYTAARLLEYGVMSPDDILTMYEAVERNVQETADAMIGAPRLSSAQDVMSSIVPPARKDVKRHRPTQKERAALFKDDRDAMKRPYPMAKLINWTLADAMLEHPEIILAGEDIGPKGGVYGVTYRLHERFGPQRVINTVLDEQSILGLGIGLAHNGLLPIVEIQFLAYLHNAEDQLRGEAATLSFFSKGHYTNPMIIRIAGLGYQKGFGGHFHNDNSIAVLRDIPGIIVACPSNGRDAALMLRECIRLARQEQRVVVFLEPIALYATRDLYAPKDEQWSAVYEETWQKDTAISIGEIEVYGEGDDLCILSYGNGYYLSRQAEPILKEAHHISSRIVDMRWLHPLPIAQIVKAVGACRRVLIVDECRITGSLSDTLMAQLYERLPDDIIVRRIAAEDSFIPLGPASTLTLPSGDDIIASALEMMDQ